MSLTLRVPRELVSPNRWGRMHWRHRHRLTQEWERDIWALSRVDPKAPLETRAKRRLTIIRETPTLRSFIRDRDNQYGACKPLCDALKRLALIVDDSQQWLEIAPLEQRLSLDGYHWTVIELQPVGEV